VKELQTLWLPLAVAALAVIVLLVDLALPQPTPGGAKSRPAPLVGAVVILGLAGLFCASFFYEVNSGSAMHGAYRASYFATYLQRLFLVGGLLGALGGLDDVAKRTPRRQGEFWLMLLSSLTGMMILPGARDLLLIVIAFELMGIPLYIMAAYSKTDAEPTGAGAAPRGWASEAGLKMYLVGATSTAITLFGLALLTGMQGTSKLDLLAATPLSPLAALGLVFVLGGVGYKIGMVPFHMWVPDTYQGASTPFVAFLSVAPKAAGMSVLTSIFLFGLGAQKDIWLPPMAIIAFLSMGVGNLLALPQTDLRRLLGYSGIAQMGYVLVALAANDAMGLGMVLFFLTAYLFTNLGAFLVVHTAAEAGGGFTFSTLSGLHRRSPGLALALLMFLLSLAGIPFVIGFWAKLYVFLAAWRAGLVGLVISGIVLAVMGLFYYLRVLQAAYMTDEGDLPIPKPAPALKLAIGLCFAAVVGLGLWPRPLIEASTRAGAELMAPLEAAHAHGAVKLTQR
jgi:NADH-quinone oxidoreductase subunit N